MIRGFLLAVQFFTAVPVRKNLPIGRKETIWMFTLNPVVGALIGAVSWSAAALAAGPGGTGPFLTAFILVLMLAVLSGGLHLDGWADMGDAYFSYRDQNKRLEILGDPRIGAFGTMALLFLLLGKLAVLTELIGREGLMPAFIVFVPFAARAGLSIYLSVSQQAKRSGVLVFFIGKLKGVRIGIPAAAMLALGGTAAAAWSDSLLFPAVGAAAVLMAVLFFRSWTVRNFGGATGDLAGAFVEGCELLLWTILLFCM
jgi:adenosylcobinamide-GDP ribazoletransferase